MRINPYNNCICMIYWQFNIIKLKQMVKVSNSHQHHRGLYCKYRHRLHVMAGYHGRKEIGGVVHGLTRCNMADLSTVISTIINDR